MRTIAMLGALLAATATSLVAAQMGGDLQAQIVYAAQAEDGNALASIRAGLRSRIADGADDDALAYHLAHADYRQVGLDAASRPREAATEAAECIDLLARSLRHSPRDAELLLLQSACYAARAASGSIEAVLDRRRAAQRLDEALRADPHNPRALLIAAQRGLSAGDADAPARAQAVQRLRESADAFTRASATDTDRPGWGDVEAWVALGLELQRGGDVLGARNWIERALIANPDCRAAQRAREGLLGH